MKQKALEQFYSDLEKVSGRKWRMAKRTIAIRCGSRCPIEVAEHVRHYSDAGKKLSMTGTDLDEIADVADGFVYTRRQRAIRSRMLEILGLSEVQS